MPLRLVRVGSKPSKSPGPAWVMSCAKRMQTTAPSPTVSNAARMVVQYVERTDRSFVHSDRSRFPKPTVVAGDRPAGGETTALVTTHRPGLGSQRCRRLAPGTQPPRTLPAETARARQCRVRPPGHRSVDR